MPPESPSWASFIAAWEIFRAPMLCALIAGSVLGFLSVYVLLRRMVFVSASITHAAALGVALAFYAQIHLGLQLEPIYGAAALSLLATLVLLIDPQRLRLSREALLGLLFAACGGAAVLVGDRIAQEAHDIRAILFGTAVMVRSLDLLLIAGAGAATIVLHLWGYRGLSFASFDPVAARVQGLPVAQLQGFILLTIGLMVGLSARALGALPVFALSTLPAMAAIVSGCRLSHCFVVATVAGGAAGFCGYALAFFLEFPVGATQTVTAVALVLIALAGRAVVGLVADES